ncbi:MAG: hypothetical protein CMJ19_14600 [Phycisphaeraceae bacterium]|nr:hypothetical protein [Phycisphaeraceae bacterium]
MSACSQKTLENKAQMPMSDSSSTAEYRLGDARFNVQVVTEIDPTAARFEKWGQRFDRSAAVTAITFNGHQMVNQLGLPDEYGQLGVGVIGFDDAASGETFIKPGVGVMVKPGSDAYRSSNRYDFVLTLEVTVEKLADQLVVKQVSPDVRGYAFVLIKTYEVDTKSNTLVITYQLSNVGKRAFELEHYNHNFLTLDNKPFGQQYHITLGKPIPSLPHSWMHMAGNRLVIEGDPGAVGFVQVNEPFTATQADLKMMTADGKLGIELTGDMPAYRFAHFFTAKSYSPERFTRVSLAPDEQVSWQARYYFLHND